MTRLASLLLVLALVIPAASVFAQEEKQEIAAESKISAVTVYGGRAKVTRLATVSIPAGAHTVVLTGLPPTLFPDSLRAEGSAKADVKFGAVSHKPVMSAQLTSSREQEMTTKLEALQDQVNIINAEKAAIEAQRNFLSTLGQQASLRSGEEIAEINLKPEQWQAAAQTIQSGVAEALKALVAQDQKLRELNREMQKIQNEMNLLRTDQRSTITVSVPLESSSATELKLELSYQVPNATWKPIYDARLSSEGKGDLKLVQFGAVSQQTGEDWGNVKLTLSTAQPQRGASLPDLFPMWVDAYEHGGGISSGYMQKSAASRGGAMQNFSSNILSMEGAMDSAAEMAAPAAPPEQEKAATFVAAEINSGGFVTEYNIPGPATVLADGTETKLMVGGFDTSAKLEIHVKPQLASDAYLVAIVKLKGESPILPGQVNLFRDGAFVGQTAIRLLRPDEEYGLYFGIDDQVAVKRKTLKDERQETGVIARDSVLERQYVTEIQNLHTTPIDLVVKETTPVPRNEKVKLEVLKDSTTQGYATDGANIKGMLQWAMKLEPKQKTEVKLGWTLSWPKDYSLSGLQ